jgi:hypothetical protein
MRTIRFTAIAFVLASGVSLLATGCGGGTPAGGNTAGTGPGGDTGGTTGGDGGAAGGSSTAGAGGSTGAGGAAGDTGGTTGTGGGAAGTGGTTAGGGAAGAAGRGGSGGTTGGRGGTTGGRGGTTGGGGAAGTAGGGRGGSAGTTGGRGGTTGTGGSPAGTPTIFYLDVGGAVMTAAAENPMPRTLVASAGQGPDGIAIDLAAGYLFWTGMGNPSADDGFIRRSNLDGSNMVTLVPAGGTYTPKQMRVDPASGKLYWSDREGMRVQRANVNGSSVETLVTTGTTATDRMDESRWCVGMAIDTAGGWFYWSQKGGDNEGVGSIRRAHIQMPAGQTSTNRNDIEILFSGLPEPIDLELDLEAGMIYWADRGDDTINRAPIAIPAGSTAATRADRQIIVRQVPEAIGVAIDKRRGRLYYTGGTGELGRANLDGSNKQEITVSGGAFTGIVVVDLP